MDTIENSAIEEAAAPEAANPDTEAQQKERARRIRMQCDIRELSSIVDTWDEFLASDCEERFYEGYIAELRTAILPLISTAKDPETLRSMQTLLSKDPVRFAVPLERLEKKLEAIDIGQRTYRGIVLESPEAVRLATEEGQRLEEMMRDLSRNSLDSIDAAIAQVNASSFPVKKLYLDTLQDLRLQLVQKGMTFRGVLYESPAQAEHAKQVYTWAQGIYNSLNRSDAAAVKAARDHLTKANHKATEEFIARMDEILVNLEQQQRTVDGHLFETMEEANTARQELSGIRTILSALRGDDEPALLDAKAQISACTTPIREKYLQTVEQLLADYDKKQRTFGNILFDTREDAQQAKETYQEFMTRFKTMDLAQPANLVLLENYIATTLQERIRTYATGLVQEVRMVHTRIAYIRRTDAALDLATQKKESADLYRFIEETIPVMTKHRINTDTMESLKKKHYASLTVGKKFLNLFKK